MSQVIADMSMSLDGFIADPDDQVGSLFDWFSAGDVQVTFPGDGRTVRVSEPSATHLRRILTEVGALICGRRLYDHTHGWQGESPGGCARLRRHARPAADAPVLLEDPQVIPGTRVTHLYYPVRNQPPAEGVRLSPA